MIRNAIFGFSLIALSAGSAFAGPVKHHAQKPVVVAEASAPAADTAAPAGEATEKKAKKSSKKDKGAKAEKGEKTEGAKEIKAPVPAAMPAPATK